jgi:outer membrane protein assembly factor BamA
MKKIIWLLFGLWSCAPVKPLTSEQYYFAGYRFSGNQVAGEDVLAPLLTQKPNSFVGKSRISPYVAAYFLGKKRFSKDSVKILKKIIQLEKKTDQKIVKISQKQLADTLKLSLKIRNIRSLRSEKIDFLQSQLENGNWLMTSVGEKPVFFDSAKAHSSAVQIKRYYSNLGFYQTDVAVKIDTLKKKRLVVHFQIKENESYTITDFQYSIADTLLKRLVLSDSLNRIPKIGSRFSYNALQAERERLTAYLVEKGFFTFRNQAIYFQVDTSSATHSAKVALVLSHPNKKQSFRPYTISKTSFYSDRGVSTLDTAVGKIFFYQDQVRFHIKTLLNKIFIYPGNTFSEQEVNLTQRALRDTDMFKFVNVQFDTISNELYANIFTSPFKKYEYSSETGLNVTQALPGPFVRVSIKDRNVFGRLDIMELSLRGALESQASATSVQAQSRIAGAYFSSELGGSLSLSFPRIMFPLSLKIKDKLNRRTPRTTFNLSYALIERPEYSRQNTISGFRYRWKNNKNQILNITPFEAVLVNTSRIADNFNNRLLELFNQGNPLIYSFSRSLVSSSIFEFINPYLQSGTSTRGKYLRAEFETGGTYQNFFAKSINEKNEVIGRLRVFRFVRTALDMRYTKPTSLKSQIVGRLFLGAIYAYSPSGALPYEKFFFSGGSNGNRAWPPRRVGPGSFRPTVNANGFFEYSFEQPGEIVVEANIEYRRKLFSFINFASFIDASNVWLFREDPSRPGGQFLLDKFYKDLAIGTGLGIRLDFSFLLVRFDLGIKAYDPARPQINRFILPKVLSQPPLGERGQAVFNLGIGYPF